MILNSPIKYLYAFILVLFFSSCEEFHEIEFQGLRDIKLAGMKDGEILIKAKAYFNNPNNTTVKLKSADIDLFFDGEKVGKLKPDGPVRIKKQMDFVIPVTASFKPTGDMIVKNLMSLFSKQEKTIELKGYISVRSWLLPFKIPVEHSEKIKI